MPGQPWREAAWWAPKDDKALLQGYYKHGGIFWAHKAITAAMDSILSDQSLDFTVKVTVLAVTVTSIATALLCNAFSCNELKLQLVQSHARSFAEASLQFYQLAEVKVHEGLMAVAYAVDGLL